MPSISGALTAIFDRPFFSATDERDQSVNHWARHSRVGEVVRKAKEFWQYISLYANNMCDVAAVIRHVPGQMIPAIEQFFRCQGTFSSFGCAIESFVDCADNVEWITDINYFWNNGAKRDIQKRRWGSLIGHAAFFPANGIGLCLSLQGPGSTVISWLGGKASQLGTYRAFAFVPKLGQAIVAIPGVQAAGQSIPRFFRWIKNARPCGLAIETIATAAYVVGFAALSINAYTLIAYYRQKERDYLANPNPDRPEKAVLNQRKVHLAKLDAIGYGAKCALWIAMLFCLSNLYALGILGTCAMFGVGYANYYRSILKRRVE